MKNSTKKENKWNPFSQGVWEVRYDTYEEVLRTKQLTGDGGARL